MKTIWIWMMVSGLSIAAGAAKMAFDRELVEIEVGPGQEVVTAAFPFKIVEDDETIEKVEVLCVCLGARVEPLNPDRSAKLNWKVGEEGVIKIRFDTSKFLGTVEKAAALKLAGTEEPIRLITRVTIPELIKVEPTTLKWAKGQEAEEKIATVTITHDEPIKILSHAGRNTEDFPYTLVTVEEGRKYEIHMKPTSTAKSGMSMVSLRTDSEHPRFKRAAVYGVVRPELRKRVPKK